MKENGSNSGWAKKLDSRGFSGGGNDNGIKSISWNMTFQTSHHHHYWRK